jgi:hypothetical protein
MTEWPQGTGVASISRSSSALPGVASASHGYQSAMTRAGLPRGALYPVPVILP